MKKMYYSALLVALCACSSEDSTVENNIQDTSLSTLRQSALNEVFNRLDVGSGQTLTCISFADEQNGVIFGVLGEGIVTNDAGVTWSHLDTPRDEVSYSSGFMYDSRTIFAGRTSFYKLNGNAMERKGNMGNYSGTIKGIHFFTPDDGIMIKEAAVVKTADSGENWTISLSGASYLTNLDVVSQDAIFAYGGTTRDGGSAGELHMTLDGGTTWTDMNYRGAEIMCADFIDEKVGYLADAANRVFKTTDSGASWTYQGTIPSARQTSLSSLLYVSAQQMFATSYDGKLYKSVNGGMSWTVHSSYQESLHEIYRIGNSLYVIGDNGLALKN